MRKINWLNVLLPAFALVGFGFYMDNEYYLGVAVLILFHALNATGFNILLGYTGIISIGQAAFFGIGAYFAGVLSATYATSPLIAIPVAVVVAFVVGFILAWPVLRLHGHYLAMATLGFGMIIYICLNEMDFITGGPSGLVGIGDLTIGSLQINTEKSFYTFMSIFFVICMFIFELMDKSFMHYKLKFIKSSESASSSYGINVTMTKVLVFASVSAFTALIGSLYAYYTHFISPVSFGLHYSIGLVAMATVGGLGYILGGVVGAVILGLIPEIFADVEEFEMIIYGGFLAFTIMFLPGGLVGTFSRVVDKIVKRK